MLRSNLKDWRFVFTHCSRWVAIKWINQNRMIIILFIILLRKIKCLFVQNDLHALKSVQLEPSFVHLLKGLQGLFRHSFSLEVNHYIREGWREGGKDIHLCLVQKEKLQKMFVLFFHYRVPKKIKNKTATYCPGRSESNRFPCSPIVLTLDWAFRGQSDTLPTIITTVHTSVSSCLNKLYWGLFFFLHLLGTATPQVQSFNINTHCTDF